MEGYKPGHLYFASESVGEGHPDKLCDQVSDAILDACLRVDPNARVAMETATKTGMVSIGVFDKGMNILQNFQGTFCLFYLLGCFARRNFNQYQPSQLRGSC